MALGPTPGIMVRAAAPPTGLLGETYIVFEAGTVNIIGLADIVMDEDIMKTTPVTYSFWSSQHATAFSSSYYHYQTALMHELGHALGLDHSTGLMGDPLFNGDVFYIGPNEIAEVAHRYF